MPLELDDLKKFWQFLKFAHSKNSQAFSPAPMFMNLFERYLTKALSNNDLRIDTLKVQLKSFINTLENETDLHAEYQLAKKISDDIGNNSSEIFELAADINDLPEILKNTQPLTDHFALIFLDKNLQKQYKESFELGRDLYAAGTYEEANEKFAIALKLLPENSPLRATLLFWQIDSLLLSKSFFGVFDIIKSHQQYFKEKKSIPNFIHNIASKIFETIVATASDNSEELVDTSPLIYAGYMLFVTPGDKDSSPNYLELIFSIYYCETLLIKTIENIVSLSEEETNSRIKLVVNTLKMYEKAYSENETFKTYHEYFLPILKNISLLLENMHYNEDAFYCNQLLNTLAIKKSDKHYAKFKESTLAFIEKFTNPENTPIQPLINEAILFLNTSLNESQYFDKQDRNEIIVFGIKTAMFLIQNKDVSQRFEQALTILNKISFKEDISLSEKVLEGMGYLFWKLPDNVRADFTEVFVNYLQKYNKAIQQLVPNYLDCWLKSLIAFINQAPNDKQLHATLETVYLLLCENQIELDNKLEFEFTILYCQSLVNTSLDEVNTILKNYFNSTEYTPLNYHNDHAINLFINMASHYHQQGKNQWKDNNKEAIISFQNANYYYLLINNILNLKNNPTPPDENKMALIKGQLETLIYLGKISQAEEIINNYKKYTELDYLVNFVKEFEKIIADKKKITSDMTNSLTQIWSARNNSSEMKEAKSELNPSNKNSMDYKKN